VTWQADAETGHGIGAAHVARALAEAVSRACPAVVVLADTATGRQLAAQLARHLGCGAILGCSDVLAADGVPVLVKPVYGGWLEQDCRSAIGMPLVATLDLAGVEVSGAAEEEGATAGTEAFASAEVVEVLGEGSPSVRRLELVPPDPRSVDLAHAKRIVAAGAGGASERLLSAVGELADLLEGSLGATRPVVDEGRLPKERLIGQTGKTVSPELYLALGISGSPHHMAGVQKAGRILTINRDARAPIFGFSDVGYVADLEAVLPLLLEKMKAWRDGPRGADDAA
jgi:electron transfer flavoprotein alpha subunit